MVPGCNNFGVPLLLRGPDKVGVNSSIIEVKASLSTLGNPTNFDNISADVNDCCVPSPVVLDDVPCVALGPPPANTAAVVISRLDDFIFPAAEFGVEFELELSVAGITGITATVGAPHTIWRSGTDSGRTAKILSLPISPP